MFVVLEASMALPHLDILASGEASALPQLEWKDPNFSSTAKVGVDLTGEGFDVEVTAASPLTSEAILGQLFFSSKVPLLILAIIKFYCREEANRLFQ